MGTGEATSAPAADTTDAILALEMKTGKLRWKFKAGGSITSTPAIVNDVLYVGSFDHHLYALTA